MRTRRPRPTTAELSLACELLAVLPPLVKLAWNAAAECGLGSPERSRLLMVLSGGPQRSGQVAQHLHVSPATVTETIDALVADGLVRRVPDQVDRRAVLIELTAEGRRQRERFEQAAAARLAEVVGRLTPAQQEGMRTAFADLRDAFAAAAEAAGARRPTTPKELDDAR